MSKPRALVVAVCSSAVLALSSCAGGSAPTAPTPIPSASRSYTGAFSAQMIITTIVNASSGNTCTSTRAVSGRLRMDLEEKNGVVTGRAQATADQPEISTTGPRTCTRNVDGITSTATWNFTAAVTGTPSNLIFHHTAMSRSGPGDLDQAMQHLDFEGELTTGVVTGMLSYDQSGFGVAVEGATFTENASTTMFVTIR